MFDIFDTVEITMWVIAIVLSLNGIKGEIEKLRKGIRD